MNFSKSKQKVIGMYLPDGSDLYNVTTLKARVSEKYKGYLPIINAFTHNASSEIVFSDLTDKNREVVTYNRCSSTKNLDQSTVRSRRIEITHNDLYMSPIRIALNFTSEILTINLPNEIRKTFTPIEQDKFSEYSGKFVIFTIHTLNTPSFIHDITGVGNYLETLHNQLKNKPGEEIEFTRELYSFAEENWSLFKKQPNGCIANSIKVISLLEIDEKELHLAQDKSVYIGAMECHLSMETIVSIKENPVTQFNSMGGKDFQSVLRNSSITCYIVDNDDRVGDRYINVAGSVRKVDRIKNPTVSSGLYIIQTDQSKKTNVEIVCSIDDLDKSGYVYKSMEEANLGASVKDRYKDELELTRQKLEAAKLESASSLIELKTQYERDLAELKLNSESRKGELEHKTLDKKSDLEHLKIQNEEMRDRLKVMTENHQYNLSRNTAETKYRYEERKYERDTFLEGLKVIGAGLGLAVTFVALHKKFS